MSLAQSHLGYVYTLVQRFDKNLGGGGWCLLSSIGNSKLERGLFAIIMIDVSECMEDSLNVHNDSFIQGSMTFQGICIRLSSYVYSLKFPEGGIDNSELPVQKECCSFSHLSLT